MSALGAPIISGLDAEIPLLGSDGFLKETDCQIDEGTGTCSLLALQIFGVDLALSESSRLMMRIDDADFSKMDKQDASMLADDKEFFSQNQVRLEGDKRKVALLMHVEEICVKPSRRMKGSDGGHEDASKTSTGSNGMAKAVAKRVCVPLRRGLGGPAQGRGGAGRAEPRRPAPRLPGRRQAGPEPLLLRGFKIGRSRCPAR